MNYLCEWLKRMASVNEFYVWVGLLGWDIWLGYSTLGHSTWILYSAGLEYSVNWLGYSTGLGYLVGKIRCSTQIGWLDTFIALIGWTNTYEYPSTLDLYFHHLFRECQSEKGSDTGLWFFDCLTSSERHGPTDEPKPGVLIDWKSPQW